MLRTAVLVVALAGLSHQTVAPRATNNSDLAPLRFDSSGTFQISIFEDLHFGQSPSGSGPAQDRKSVQVIGDALDYDTPDLVVLNGDLLDGYNMFSENSTTYLDQIVAPIMERNLTWAASYGNHDRNYNLSADALFEREQTFNGSRTQRMVSDDNAGVTNYYLPVYASNCTNVDDCTPELILWFFDSRGGYYFQGSDQPNWVDTSVVTWFNETNTKLVEKHNRVIPSLAFVHIPVNASFALQNIGVDETRQPGINEETVVQQGAEWCTEVDGEETCGYSGQDAPFMEALVSIPGVIGLFSGHDHANTWCYKWDSLVGGMNITGNGINLCYGQHSGYGGYGDYIRGARQIVVTQEKLRNLTVDTHIRLESGDVVGSISLNSTYNEDSYSRTPNTKTYLNTDDLTVTSESSTVSISEKGIGSIYTSIGLFLATTLLLTS